MLKTLGDSCCFSYSMGAVKELIQEILPDIYVHSVSLGNNEAENIKRSYFGNINEQIEEACQKLSKDEQLKDGYNAIGFSQGAQLMRALIQRCPNPPVRNYISIGGQQQGVAKIEGCGILWQDMCKDMLHMIKQGVYLRSTQKKSVQAAYIHDPYKEEEYKKQNIFLADVNNEMIINNTYKENLLKLKTMVLVKFKKDVTVWPPESQWFGFYEPGQTSKILTVWETELYTKDHLGLKLLEESGKLHFLSVSQNHLVFTKTWFVNKIIKPYLM